jgi:hypothetical protein
MYWHPFSLDCFQKDAVKVFASQTLKQCLQKRGSQLTSAEKKQYVVSSVCVLFLSPFCCRYQGVMANVLAANWKSSKLILTNLSICLVSLLIQGVSEQPQRKNDFILI